MRWFRRLNEKRAKKAAKRAKRAAVAGATAVIAVGTGLGLSKALAAYTPDPHELSVAKDADADLLANTEERAIGYRVFRPDQNHNEIPDGAELAKRCADVVSELPVYTGGPPPNETYKIEIACDGLEQCDVCGEWIHMCGWVIINPALGLRYPCPSDPLDGEFLPDLTIHYMEHGSFSCAGHLGKSEPWHVGRVDLPYLMRVLGLRYPHDPNEHELGLGYVVGSEKLASDANDLDGDLLADSEELATDLNLYNADQDQDLTPDGIELAKQCARVIDELPVEGIDPIGQDQVYKECYFQYGLELCEICSEAVDMGFWRIVNPKLGLSIDVYDVLCHYMSHGSFSYSGLQIDPPYDPFHNGRVNIARLLRILEMPQQCGDLPTMYLPGDTNEDCRVNLSDVAGLANEWLNCTEPHEEGCIE